MRCSTTKVTIRMIPERPSSEVWATVIIHEYFYGFQFNDQKYLDYFEKNIALLGHKSFYFRYNGYKESVDRKNEILLSNIISTDSTEIKTLIASFFQIRERRRAYTKQKLNVDIKAIEEIFETIKGTARYRGI